MPDALLPAGLAPPISLALAKAVERIPEAGALPGGCLYEPKWDGFIHWTLSICGPSACCRSANGCRTDQLRLAPLTCLIVSDEQDIPTPDTRPRDSVLDLDLTFPRKLKPGDLVRVIAPARSRAMVLEHDHSALIEKRFGEVGLRLSTVPTWTSVITSIPHRSPRISDLHTAFADPDVAGILNVIGGFNNNELLPYLDWDLITDNLSTLQFCAGTQTSGPYKTPFMPAPDWSRTPDLTGRALG